MDPRLRGTRLSGFFLLLERPFRIGDEVRVGQWEGSVESVLMRVTVLRAADGEKIQIPNQEVYTSAIIDRLLWSSLPALDSKASSAKSESRPFGGKCASAGTPALSSQD